MSDKKEENKEEVVKDTTVVKFATVRRHSTVDTLNGASKDEVYEFPKTPDTPYIVDDSAFIPLKEALKGLKDNQIANEEIKVYYDFPDGQDNGKAVPINRRHDVKDVTELSQAIMDEVKDRADKIDKLSRKAKLQQAEIALDAQAQQAQNNATKE